MEKFEVENVLRFVWHVTRYSVATCVSTVVTAILPVLISCIPIALAIVWVLSWVAAFLLYALTGETIGVEMEEPIGLVIVPLGLLVVGFVALVISVLLAIAFSILVVLPLSLITEFICRWLSIRTFTLRLASFLLVGLLLGFTLNIILLLIGGFNHLQTSPLVLLGLGIWLALTCFSAVFMSGLSLMTMSFTRNGIIHLWRRITTWITCKPTSQDIRALHNV